MKTKYYVAYDRTAQECSQPFAAKNDSIAQRIFWKGMVDVDYSDEFELYKLCEIDTETLEISNAYPEKITAKVTDEEASVEDEVQIEI